MKNLFNSFYSIVLLALCLIAFSNCSDSDDGGDVGDTDNGITAIGTETEKTASIYGETVEISFTASGKWTPSLQYSTGADWATITNTSGNSAAGKGGFCRCSGSYLWGRSFSCRRSEPDAAPAPSARHRTVPER